MDYPALLPKVTAIAVEAGEAIMEIYTRDFEVVEKADRSPLTEADMRAHRLIVTALEQLTPAIPVLSEESGEIPWEKRREWDRYWLVDPLDGTKEFVKKNGEFTVNIALIEDHRPVLGVVHAPAIERTYSAATGLGAFAQGVGEARPEPIHVRPHSAGRPWRVVGSRSHPSGRLASFLERLGEHEMVAMGSSLKLCLVAEGRADVYPRLGPTSEWDTAAAQAVVEQAGGSVHVTETLAPLTYNEKDDLLNPAFIVTGSSQEIPHRVQNALSQIS